LFKEGLGGDLCVEGSEIRDVVYTARFGERGGNSVCGLGFSIRWVEGRTRSRLGLSKKKAGVRPNREPLRGRGERGGAGAETMPLGRKGLFYIFQNWE